MGDLVPYCTTAAYMSRVEVPGGNDVDSDSHSEPGNQLPLPDMYTELYTGYWMMRFGRESWHEMLPILPIPQLLRKPRPRYGIWMN